MKAYTDLEQSKKLAEFLPIESADMCWTNHCYGSIRSSMTISAISTYEYKKLLERFADSTSIDVFYHAWSLAALLEYLRKHDLFPEIKDAGDYILMDITFSDENEVVEESINPVHFIRAEGKNILDACYELIIKLRENNLI